MVSDPATKHAIRARMRARLREVPRDEREDRSRLIARRLFDTSEWADASVVLTYLAMADEVDTEAIVVRALDDGKVVGAPRLSAGSMAFGRLEAPDEAVAVPDFRFRVPPPGSPNVEPPATSDPSARRTLLIVPGLAFDRDGARLGRGGGYYDRFLAAHRSAVVAVGIAFESQLVPRVPKEEFDEGVELIVTEREVIRVVRDRS